MKFALTAVLIFVSGAASAHTFEVIKKFSNSTVQNVWKAAGKVEDANPRWIADPETKQFTYVIDSNFGSDE